MPRRDQCADILVAGGGPSGATIATLLAMRGKRVTLIDPEINRVRRLELIAPPGIPVLQALQLTWLLDDRSMSRPCLGIRRRWGISPTETDDFVYHRGGTGFVIDRRRFDGVLRAEAQNAGVDVVTARVVGVERTARGIAATIRTEGSQRVVLADCIVDATGRSAAVSRRLGALRLRAEPRIAEWRRVDPQPRPSEDPVWLEVEGSDSCWSYRISGPGGLQESWTIYPAPRRTGAHSRVCTDASSACLLQAAADKRIAVGDAAAAFDPIASQGLVNALATSVVAAGVFLSPRGLDEEACMIYSQAVLATVQRTEIGRAWAYATLGSCEGTEQAVETLMFSNLDPRNNDTDGEQPLNDAPSRFGRHSPGPAMHDLVDRRCSGRIADQWRQRRAPEEGNRMIERWMAERLCSGDERSG